MFIFLRRATGRAGARPYRLHTRSRSERAATVHTRPANPNFETNISHHRGSRVRISVCVSAMDHFRYFASDPADPGFQVTGVIEGDELVLDIRTESESGERSLGLWGLEHLRKVMAHFAPRYRSVRTSWWVGDNLKAFNRAIAVGATPEQAAIRTPIGHQLALTGYSQVLLRSLKGHPARYTEVVVSFFEPSA